MVERSGSNILSIFSLLTRTLRTCVIAAMSCSVSFSST